MLRIVCCLGVIACGQPEAPVQVDPRSGQVVARVDGETVTAGDVEALATAEGLSAQEALDTLEREALLVAEARRRGVVPDEDAQRRLAVRALLDRMAAESRPEDIPAEEVEVSFEAGRAQGERPEIRQATLLAVRGDALVARRVARRLLSEMREDADATIASVRSEPQRDGVETTVEEVELNESEAPVAAALFAARCAPPCVLPEIVDDQDRLVVVQLRGVTAPVRLRLEDVEDEIRRQLAIAARARALEEFLASKREGVTLDEDAVARAVQDGALPDPER